MKAKSIILLFLLSISFVSINAQQQRRGSGKFDLEKFQKSRADFFIKELNLTATEAKAFIPLMNELMLKKYQLNREVKNNHRALNQKAAKTDAEYLKAVDMALDARIKEAQLQKEYMQKFKAVLPAEKIYKFHHVEMKFMEQALKDHREKARKKD